MQSTPFHFPNRSLIHPSIHCMTKPHKPLSTNAAMDTNSAWTKGDLPPTSMPSENEISDSSTVDTFKDEAESTDVIVICHKFKILNSSTFARSYNEIMTRDMYSWQHIHTHTHMNTHACTHTHIYTHTCMHTHAHTQTFCALCSAKPFTTVYFTTGLKKDR